MSDKFTNPFLTPPVQKPNELQAPSHPHSPQQPHVNQQQAPLGQAPIGQPDQPPQMPQNPVSAPVSTPIVAPSSNPFTMAPQTPAATQTPTQVSTQMPAQTPAQIPVQAPTQEPVLSPETAGGQPSLGHAAPPSSTLPSPPPQMGSSRPGQPQAAMPQQQVIRETAASPTAPLKTPNPFDFANQGQGGATGSSSEQTSGSGRLRYVPLVFSGTVGEYYKIVILNGLLTLITFGIFAPWAKVRKQRFFYSHTEFLDEGLQYLATGKQLFIGRIVAVLALIALAIAELIPYIGVAISIVFVLLVLPFVLNRSVRFNARNAAWRDVRFGWDGSMGMAILVWMIYPVLSALTLGLAQPLAARALRRHYAENHSFGGAQFAADLSLGAFYGALVKASLFALFLIGIFGGLGGAAAYMVVADLFEGVSSSEEFMLLFALIPDEQKALLALPFLGIGFGLFLSGQYYFALVRHVMINNLRLQGGIRFRSSLSGFKFAMLMVSNLILNIITLGFAQPYTVVRRYRYLAQSIEIRPIGDMAGFIDSQVKSGFSVFEEASDIEGLSIDI